MPVDRKTRGAGQACQEVARALHRTELLAAGDPDAAIVGEASQRSRGMGIERRLVEWDTATTPRAAKIAGATSIAVWTVVVVVGRLIAYNWFPPLA